MSRSKTIAQRLAGWAAGVKLAEIPPTVVEIARRCLIDVIGVTLAGTMTGSAKRTRDLAKSVYGTGPCRVLGTPLSLTGPGAALANGVAAHALDFDDNCYAGVVHGSAATFPAVYAASQHAGSDGETLLAGFITGVEVEYTLGLALSPSFYNRGWFSTSVLGAIGAAAGAARVLGLDEEAFSRCIGLAAGGAGGIRAVRGTEGKHYLCGRGAEAGLLAALMAGKGATGPMDVFEDRNGFLHTFNEDLFDTPVLENLGREFRLENPGVDFKPYPICYAGQAAVEAVANILAEYKLEARNIRQVICEVPPLVASNLTYENPKTVAEAQFSMQFALAAIIRYGDISLDHLTPAALKDAELRKLIKCVEMRVDEGLALDADMAKDCPECASVTVVTTDGMQHQAFNCSVTGSVAKPMPQAQLEAKFLACAGRAVDMQEAHRWLAQILDVESMPDVRALLSPVK